MPIAVSLPQTAQRHASGIKEPEARPPVQVVVRGFPPTTSQQELLRAFDQHDTMILGARRWRTEREADEQACEITFANPEDVAATLKRHAEKPFRVNGRPVRVSIAEPPAGLEAPTGGQAQAQAQTRAEPGHAECLGHRNAQNAQPTHALAKKPVDAGPLWETWGIKTERRATGIRPGAHVLATEDIGPGDAP